MATVTKTIGTTARDYSTITLWEADLDNDTPYDAGDDAVGECYDDAAFNESVTINGGGTLGLASVTLTVAAGERHDGTAGTGSRLVRNAAGNIFDLDVAATLEWLEITTSTGQTTTAVDVGAASITIDHLLIYDLGQGVDWKDVKGIKYPSANCAGNVIQNVLYSLRIGDSGSYNAVGIVDPTGNWTSADVLANTLWDIWKEAGSGSAFGIVYSNYADVKNNIAVDCIHAGAGTAACFSGTTTTGTLLTNASSDETASGTGSLTGTDGIDSGEFVSTSPVDLHLAADALCINAGTDLGTTPTGVNIDIDGRDRDAEGDTWDIGADEYVVPLALPDYPDEGNSSPFEQDEEIVTVAATGGTPPYTYSIISQTLR
ncbi:MAG: hypothetical protein JW741_17335 [Sedimentisphaerales bacterium]|nr:hypothetical protein [Sedimentisphaerales bacterium]